MGTTIEVISLSGKKKYRHGFLKKDAVQGFAEYCGLTPVSMEPGRFVTRIKVEKHHLQQDGLVHAGVIATMADHTAGYASFTLVPEDKVILTVEYKINFLRPASGELLECRAKVINQGKNILVCESEVYSIAEGDETLVAKAMLTMASVPKGKVRKM